MVDLQKQVASGTTFAGKYFKLKNDITIADDAGFTGIGTSSKKFSGKFDGNNKKITVTIVQQSMSNVGVFGYATSDAVIENLTVAGEIATGYSAGATIRNCVNEAEIMTGSTSAYGTYGTGGIAGVYVNTDKTGVHAVENCVNKGEIKAGYTSATGISKISFGGIIGAVYNSSRNVTVSGCRNEGSINEVPSSAGVAGIVGYIYTSEVALEDCVNRGDISAMGTGSNGYNGVGGIAGYYAGHSANDAVNTVERCENTGNISGRDASYAATGGIVGQAESTVTVEQCFNKGEVTAKAAYAGGIVGDSMGTIAECYNGGAVSNTKASPTSSAYAAAGGITGYNESTARLYRSYSYGKVSCTATSNVYAGGVIGRPANAASIDSEKIYSNKYLEDSAEVGIGQTASDNEACTSFEKSKANDILGTIGKAYQADMQTPLNGGYPILRWQNTDATYAAEFKVTDKETNDVLRDAKVAIEGQTAGEDGSFELTPGTYSYKVTRDGYTDVTGSVTLKKKSVSIAIEMTSVKHKYTVKIANENNAPAVADPEITKDEAADEATYVYTLADKAAYGEYRLSLSKYLYTAQTVSLEATGKDDTKTIKMEKAATEPLTIKVKPADAKVYLTNADFDVQAEARSSDNGTWTYEVVPGEYSYRVKAANHSTKTGKLTVPDDKELTVELEEKAVWDGTVDTDWYTDDTTADTYTLKNEAQLAGLARLVNSGTATFSGKTILLARDMNLEDNAWTPIGSYTSYYVSSPFSGTFDGQGHSIVIRNGEVKSSQTTLGVFGYITKATIKNLTLQGKVKISYKAETSGYMAAYAGGLAGYAVNSNIEKCSNQMNVDVDLTNEGGTVGVNMGGLVGWSVGTSYESCNNIAAVRGKVAAKTTANCYSGGIAGFVQGNAKISGCYTNMGIRAIASLETETVGGYPLAGYGYACDTYIGGIAGSLSGNVSITECYTRGTYIGAETRQVTAGGIVGAMRYPTNSVTDCYSTASIDARPLDVSVFTSYLGGIVGNGGKDGADAIIKNNFALNKYIKGNDNKTEAGKVAGNAGSSFTANYGLKDIKITGAKLNSQFDGDKLTAAQAVSAGTYSSWNKDSWKLADGVYPQLAWQTRAAGADKSTSYTGQNVNEDAEWDGYFSEQTPPPYFNLYVQVKGHAKVLAKKFTKKDMLAMAESDNQGTLYYSAMGNGYAGRAVKEYVYLDTLFGKAGVEFASGDSLTFGSYIYDHDGLMADRYYYPEWTSGSDKDAVKVKPVLALKSFGASSGVSKDYWNYYASQADYLYAYMINYGQKTPDDFTYSYFTYQQTEGTVNYKTDSAANETVKNLLSEAVGEAQLDADATYVSEDGTDVSSAYSYTDKAAKDRFGKAIDEAKAVLEKEGVINGDIMGAYDDLADAQKRFDKLKKQGKGADRTGLESAIAENMLDDVTVSKDGKNVSENEVWATERTVDALKDAIKAAKSVASDRNASQAEIDVAETAMKDALSDFVTSDGQLEPLARAAAIEELKDYTESLGLDSYREAERAQIADLLKEYKEKIENAENAGKITELLTEAKAAIGAVKNEDQAVKSEAKGELAGYKDLSRLDREDRALIREIISEYSDKIDEAKTQKEIDTLVKEAKAEIDLAIAKAEATDSLEDWYGKTELYYEAEQNKIVKIVLVNVKAIKDAESIEAVEKIVADANAAIAKLKTKAVIDNTPAKTAGVKAASASYKSVKISWKKDKKAKSYEVYRATKKNGKYTKVKTTTATSYTNGKLTTGKTYYYKVRAYGTLDGQKLYGGYSSDVKARPVPAKVKASAKAIGTWRIAVKWKKVSGASGYQIYKATTKNGKFKKLTTVKGGSKTSYTNKKLYKNQRYYYKVRAYRTVKGKAVYGSFSAVKSAKVK